MRATISQMGRAAARAAHVVESRARGGRQDGQLALDFAALREFPKLSSRGIAKLCGVGHQLVDMARPAEVDESATCERTGQDGKQYQATPDWRIAEVEAFLGPWQGQPEADEQAGCDHPATLGAL